MTRHANCAEPSSTARLRAPEFALIAILFAMCNPAFALDPGRNVSQYGHTSWRLQDGVFQGVPQAITQTTDGYLWIGTGTGLARFDGVRFVPLIFRPGENLRSSSIYALLGAKDGSLWIGTGAGLSHWKDGHLVNYPESAGRITALQEDQDGTVWFVRTRGTNGNGPFCRVRGESVKCYGQAEGITFRWASSLLSDGEGGFWIGAASGTCHWTKQGVTNYFPENLRNATGQTGVTGLGIMRDGSLLAGVGQSGVGLGLRTLSSGVWRDFSMPGTNETRFAVATLAVDRDSGIWISPEEGGIYHLHKGHADRFLQTDGLSGNSISGFFEDREGNIWTISSEGIDRFRDLTVGTVSTREGFPPAMVGSVSASQNGKVWVGGGTSLNQISEGKRLTVERSGGIPVRRVTSLLEDHAGRLWIGAEAGLWVMENEKFQPLTKARDGSTLDMAASIVEDSDNNVWALIVGRAQRLICIRNMKVIEEITLGDHVFGGAIAAASAGGGLWVGNDKGGLVRYRAGQPSVMEQSGGAGPVRNVLANADGSTWAATAKGLIRRKDGRREQLGMKNGLVCDDLFSAINDDAGHLWIYASCGLMRISPAELERWWREPSSAIRVQIFDTYDGAHPAAASFAPVATKSADGSLWFTNDTAIQFVNPRQLTHNSLPPPVQIEQIIADRVNYAPSNHVRLPALTRDVQIDYTALSIAVPQKVKFRYKLDGRDDGWEDAGNRRQAFYTDLSPGNYRFRVIACNNDGVWNETGASLAFGIAPAYYQTAWFYLACGTVAMLALWSVYQIRLRQIAGAMSLRFDERMAERNRLSGELHDTILQSVQISKMVADHALSDTSNANPEALRSAMVTLSEWLTQATNDGRAALNALRSSTTPTRDLVEAFRQAAELSQVTGAVEFVVSAEGAAREMHPIVQDEIYRIGCEAIRNASVHSEASQIEIKVIFAQNLTVRVKDNGKGMDPALVITGRPGHFGLPGMQERATRIGARFHVVSRPGAGTEIELAVPGNIVYARAGAGTILAKLRALRVRRDEHK